MSIVERQLLELLRSGLWNLQPDASIFKNADWDAIISLAKKETVAGLLLVGATRLPKDLMPDKENVIQLAGRENRNVQRNKRQRATIVIIDKALKENGITAVYIKGQITGLRYPKPLHRQPGDIDFVVSKNDFPKTLDVLETIGKVNRSIVHEHHGIAFVNGILVEPHFKVHNYQRPSTDKSMQMMFDEIFPDKLIDVNIDGYKVKTFPPTFESVFLVSHMVNHIYEEGLGLRQVIDYAMFLYKCHDSIQWSKHNQYLTAMRMQRSFRIFACICVEYLRTPMPEQIKPFTDEEKRWARKTLNDIFVVGNFGRGIPKANGTGLRRAFNRYLKVLRRCSKMYFVCPSEALWWSISKFTRFFKKEKAGLQQKENN